MTVQFPLDGGVFEYSLSANTTVNKSLAACMKDAKEQKWVDFFVIFQETTQNCLLYTNDSTQAANALFQSIRATGPTNPFTQAKCRNVYLFSTCDGQIYNCNKCGTKTIYDLGIHALIVDVVNTLYVRQDKPLAAQQLQQLLRLNPSPAHLQ